MICSVAGCAKSVQARGWCGTHYKRWQIHGDPTTVLTVVTAECRRCGAVDWAYRPRGRECRTCRRRRYHAPDKIERNRRQARESMARSRSADPERHREANRRSYAKHNKQRSTRARAYYQENKDRAQSWGRDRHDRNRDARNAARRRRYREHDEARAARERRAADKGRVRDAARRWRLANPEKQRAADRNKRARRLRAEGRGVTAADVRAIYEAQHGQCRWCDCELHENFHVDHVVPLARGGRHEPENACVACPTCNCRKGALLLDEWERRRCSVA